VPLLFWRRIVQGQSTAGGDFDVLVRLNVEQDMDVYLLAVDVGDAVHGDNKQFLTCARGLGDSHANGDDPGKYEAEAGCEHQGVAG
jgi:hypothetical protein